MKKLGILCRHKDNRKALLGKRLSAVELVGVVPSIVFAACKIITPDKNGEWYTPYVIPADGVPRSIETPGGPLCSAVTLGKLPDRKSSSTQVTSILLVFVVLCIFGVICVCVCLRVFICVCVCVCVCVPCSS